VCAWQHLDVPERKDWRKTTLVERLLYALQRADERWPTERKRGAGDTRLRGVTALAKAMGVAPGTVTSMIKREKARAEKAQDEKARDTGPAPQTFRKIADAIPVSYLWLTLGEGQPEDVNPWAEGYCRELEIAIEFMGGARRIGEEWVEFMDAKWKEALVKVKELAESGR